MDNSVTAQPLSPTIIDGQATSQDTVVPLDNTNANALTSSDAKARQFADMLNQQQQITELGIKYENSVFDAAQDVQISAAYSEPAKLAKL